MVKFSIWCWLFGHDWEAMRGATVGSHNGRRAYSTKGCCNNCFMLWGEPGKDIFYDPDENK